MKKLDIKKLSHQDILQLANQQPYLSKYTNEEKGVRELKRCIETIYSKINLFRIMKPTCNLFEKELNVQVSFPFTVTTDIIQKLLKQESSGPMNMMYM